MSSGEFQPTYDPETGRYSLLGVCPEPMGSVCSFLHSYYNTGKGGTTRKDQSLKQRLLKEVKALVQRAENREKKLLQQASAARFEMICRSW